MKISELIATLEDVRNTNGDIDVFMFDKETGISSNVDSVDANKVCVSINVSHMMHLGE